MTSFNEFLMALFLLSCLMLAVSSRMLHCIRIVSLQGILLAILPVLVVYIFLSKSIIKGVTAGSVKG